MFKFMKSKKGFTLVELMIVVVIMAILVAVAVPIFSAVTKNAQKKTCAANIREIVSQISNHCMGGDDSGVVINEDATFTIKVDDNGDPEVTATKAGSKLTATAVEDMFQEVPYCPVDDAEYTIYVAKGASTPTINVNCSAAEHQKYTAPTTQG